MASAGLITHGAMTARQAVLNMNSPPNGGSSASSAATGGGNIVPEGELANHIFSGKTGKFADTSSNKKIK